LSGQLSRCREDLRHIFETPKDHVCTNARKKTRAGEKLARLTVQIGKPKAEVVAGKLFGEFGENGRRSS
jgi:hypothetical protein